MKRTGELPLFEFESTDSLAQFSIWGVPLAGGGPIGVLAWLAGGWKAVAAVAAACLILVVGLRSSITMRPGEVTVVKKWFFVPYRTYTATSIDDVSFGGDWGLEDGAIGVVVSMGGREIHLGTSKNMRFLHDAISEVACSGRPLSANPSFKRTPDGAA